MSVGVANVRRVIERWNRARFLSLAPGQSSPQVCTPGQRRPRATTGEALYDERPYDAITCVDLALPASRHGWITCVNLTWPAFRYPPAVLGRCRSGRRKPGGNGGALCD